MQKDPAMSVAQREYDRLRARLCRLGYISQGSVLDRTSRQGGGAGYQWTRKVAQKTVTVSLTQEQFVQMKRATANYRQARQLLKRMEMLSRTILFTISPHPNRHKRLSTRVLGTM